MWEKKLIDFEDGVNNFETTIFSKICREYWKRLLLSVEVDNDVDCEVDVCLFNSVSVWEDT